MNTYNLDNIFDVDNPPRFLEAFYITCSKEKLAFHVCCCSLSGYIRYLCLSQTCIGCSPSDKNGKVYPVSYLKHLLITKGQSLRPLIHSMFGRLYQQFLKADKTIQQMFKISYLQVKEQYQKIFKTVFLFGDQKLLFDLLNSNHKKLNSVFVNKTVHRLIQEPIYRIDRKNPDYQVFQEYLQKFKRRVDELVDILKKIRVTINEFVNIHLGKFVGADQKVQVSQKGTIVKTKTVNPLIHQKLLVVINPSISNLTYFQVLQCRLQITKCETDRIIAFGVIEFDIDLPKSSTFFYKDLKFGLFVQQGFYHIGEQKKTVELKKGLRKIEQQDIIGIQFDRKKSQVTVLNQTKNTKFIAKIVTNPGKVLYFGVIFTHHLSQVKILQVNGKRIKT